MLQKCRTLSERATITVILFSFLPFPLLLFCEFHKEKMLSHIWHMTIWHIVTVRPYNLVSTEHEDDR